MLLSDSDKQIVRSICRRMRLGLLEFHDNGSCTIHSREPILNRLKLAFPLFELDSHGEFPIELENNYWVTIFPEGRG